MYVEAFLALWTCAGLAWWAAAYWLVAIERDSLDGLNGLNGLKSQSTQSTLSIFKPLPPLGADGMRHFARGLESFARQLEDGCEMLIGVHESDRARALPFLRELQESHPHATIRLVFRSTPDEAANPKVAWQKILAPFATGELWLWSDADIVAPAGFLNSARARFGRQGERMMTFPYVAREIPSPRAVFEPLFVNADFYPGVLLLRRGGAVDFGLGAAMLFRRDDFARRVDWRELGAALADDFLLGQKLAPVRIGGITLETVPTSRTWAEALEHDYRWAKTIRWNRPGAVFARVATMPVFGWLAAVALHPGHLAAWAGLAGVIQAEACFAIGTCQRAGCHAIFRHVAACELWGLWRAGLWLCAWLPWLVSWNGRTWQEPMANIKSTEEAHSGTH